MPVSCVPASQPHHEPRIAPALRRSSPFNATAGLLHPYGPAFPFFPGAGRKSPVPPFRAPEETPLHGPARHGLDRLNSAAPGAAEAALLACCGSRHWARQLADHRPYADLAALLRAADRAARALTPADIAEALADERGPHPALLRRAGAGANTADGSAALTAIRRAQVAYEHRFGHVFVVCLDGRRPAEALGRVLAALRARLSGTVEEEAAVTAAELARLARGRLARLAPDTPCVRVHDTRQPYGA
ncbi:2-oxo-4-hydroxy-4-carboxy-5-ureidoimidazoline decarboxylase [Streptomyces sp. UNOC14_S4]|uniref:2-oxo-4-hydroxy-4-carboxy-5-ureidoimidazoline decarboxylase n=1 Tax=Streptomyces sp. UNOC14_S4 TaxID=2872340 RepID=UPI001E3175D2|nr:2-oxo-4-hydroxy-4-carboxy-5-ureidoimidazoline decarboxylase [Streptomyces sp. UNOC14_S4]